MRPVKALRAAAVTQVARAVQLGMPVRTEMAAVAVMRAIAAAAARAAAMARATVLVVPEVQGHPIMQAVSGVVARRAMRHQHPVVLMTGSLRVKMHIWAPKAVTTCHLHEATGTLAGSQIRCVPA